MVGCGILISDRFHLKKAGRGAWVAQLVECPTLAQVTISVCEFEPCVGPCVGSSEPDAGLELTDLEIVTWLKSDA